MLSGENSPGAENISAAAFPGEVLTFGMSNLKNISNMSNEIKELAKSITELKALIPEIPTEIDITDESDCNEAGFILEKLNRMEELLEYINRDLPKIEEYLRKHLRD